MDNYFKFYQIPDIPDRHILTFGTIIVEWQDTGETLDIIGVQNTDKGNGHFAEFLREMQIFCTDLEKVLRVVEIDNFGLFRHLVNEWGFMIVS